MNPTPQPSKAGTDDEHHAETAGMRVDFRELRRIQMNYPHSSPSRAYRPDLIRIQYHSAFLMLMYQLYKKYGCDGGTLSQLCTP